MKKSDINYIDVPHYDELSVKNLYFEFKSDDKFMRLFADKYP